MLAIIAVSTSVNSIACKSLSCTFNWDNHLITVVYKVMVYNLLIQNSNHNPPSPIAEA